MIIDSNHPTLYQRTVEATGVATDNFSDPSEVLSQTFHIKIDFVGRAEPLIGPDGSVSYSFDV